MCGRYDLIGPTQASFFLSLASLGTIRWRRRLSVMDAAPMTGILLSPETTHMSQQYVRLYTARGVSPAPQDLRFVQIPLELLCLVPPTKADNVWGLRLYSSILTRPDCVI